MSRATRSLGLVDLSDVIKRPLKYGHARTWSQLCGRVFASRAEALRGEELRAMEMAGDIWALRYQPRWVLSEEKPRITYTADFLYGARTEKRWIYEDVKGVLTRDARTRIAWVKDKYHISIRVLRRQGDGWEEIKL